MPLTEPWQDQQDEKPSDVSELQVSIAQVIVTLSGVVEETPHGAARPGRQLEVDDVDFGTNGWLVAVAEVQGWLRLPSRLALDSPLTSVRSLALALSPNPNSVIDPGDGEHPTLTFEGFEALLNHCERAAQLRDVFLEDLESDEGGKTYASAQWEIAWTDTIEEDEDVASGPVNAKADTWPIQTFVSRAELGELDLAPSYQRDDVWPTGDAQLLIESILRGIPIPSVILLKPSNVDELYEIVDGKQRLTSILRFMGKHPTALQTVRRTEEANPGSGLMELFASDYPKFRSRWKKLTGEQLTSSVERAHQFPFKLRTDSRGLTGSLKSLEGKYYSQIKAETILVADTQYRIRDVFEQSTEYKIPVLEYHRATRRQIHEVFNLYNKQGKHLNAEEIRNAVYHNLDLMRALLVAAGDNKNVNRVAPFLAPVWPDLGDLPSMLAAYRSGSTRYKLSKVLSWVAALLLVDHRTPTGDLRVVSTTKHINELLDGVDENPRHPLRDRNAINSLLMVLHDAVDAHSAVAAWAPRFRDTKSGAKWQELQLVATVTGVALATVVRGADVVDLLEDRMVDLAHLTDSDEWQRPSKAQNITQVQFIGFVALNVMEALGVSAEEADTALRSRFGSSSVAGHVVARQRHLANRPELS